MHKYLLAASLVAFSVPAMASCDELKSQLDAKLQAKGVASYTLEVVPAASAVPAAPVTAAASAPAASAQAPKAAGKVVGSCDGDTKKIIYRRN